MVLLRELLHGILGSVLGDDDDTCKVEIRNSREQCHVLLDTVVPHGRKMLLELRLLNQDGGSQQLLLARLTQSSSLMGGLLTSLSGITEYYA